MRPGRKRNCGAVRTPRYLAYIYRNAERATFAILSMDAQSTNEEWPGGKQRLALATFQPSSGDIYGLGWREIILKFGQQATK